MTIKTVSPYRIWILSFASDVWRQKRAEGLAPELRETLPLRKSWQRTRLSEKEEQTKALLIWLAQSFTPFSS
jgi:hypothetical protein